MLLLLLLLLMMMIMITMMMRHDADGGGDVYRHQDRPVNVDDIDYFYSQSSNERVPCGAIPDINLKPWAEAPPSPPPAPQPPAYVEPNQIPIAPKTARAAVQRFLDEVAPERLQPVFRKHHA